MRAVAVATGATIGAWRSGTDPRVLRAEPANLDGVEIWVAELELDEPRWDPGGEHREDVLVRTEAWSCNYRDGGLVQLALASGNDGYYVVGSEFSAVVEAVGDDVTGHEPGGRVIIDSCYGPGERQPWGMPTNHASRGWQILPATKLRAVPQSMDPVDAAAFSLGGQTSAAMARRAEVAGGDRVLVCSARSVTSLFCIQTLVGLGCAVTAWTSSPQNHEQLRALGASDVFCDTTELGEHARAVGGFAAVLDPFADLHLPVTVRVAGLGGRIVTCGATRSGSEPAGEEIMGPLVRKQLQVVGSCLGASADLDSALRLWEREALRIPVAAVLDAADGPGAVIDQTFGTKPRPGKVVVRYG